jgi:hypothetical protein
MKVFKGNNTNTVGGTLSMGRSNTGTIDGHNMHGSLQKTFSSLANVPRHKVNKLVAEARPLIGGARKCKEIWQAI